MENVCLCIDLEGFHLGGRFVCREMEYCDWTRRESGVKHFYLPLHYRELTDKEKSTVRWIIRNIHGLTFQPPSAADAYPHPLLDGYVRALYDCFRTDAPDTVDLKGGHVEKDLLDRLGIAHLDLEAYGCPPFRKMKRLDRVQGCGFHADPFVTIVSRWNVIISWIGCEVDAV